MSSKDRLNPGIGNAFAVKTVKKAGDFRQAPRPAAAALTEPVPMNSRALKHDLDPVPGRAADAMNLHNAQAVRLSRGGRLW